RAQLQSRRADWGTGLAGAEGGCVSAGPCNASIPERTSASGSGSADDTLETPGSGGTGSKVPAGALVADGTPLDRCRFAYHLLTTDRGQRPIRRALSLSCELILPLLRDSRICGKSPEPVMSSISDARAEAGP